MISSKFLNCVFLLSFFIIKIEAGSPSEYIPFEKWAENYDNYQIQKLSSLFSRYVIVTDTILEGCESRLSCEILLNELLISETFFQNETKLSNFYISGNGAIFTGHGWHSRVNNFSCCSGKSYIEITFITNAAYSNLKPTQIRAAQRLLEYGLVHNFLSESYVLLGAWQLKGRNFSWTQMNRCLISTWPHWSPSKIDNQCQFFPDSICLY